MSNNTWHGYPQHPDAHPDRPWWRIQGDAGAWKRADGRMVVALEWRDQWLLTIEAERVDEAHPLPAPPPLCGQVWCWPSGAGMGEDTVVAVVRFPLSPELPDAVFSTKRFRRPLREKGQRGVTMEPTNVCPVWPPEGAVLVAGPGAPWAPVKP